MALFRGKKKKVFELVYYGTATDLDYTYYSEISTLVGNYALFTGGAQDKAIGYPTTPKKYIYVYNTSLVYSFIENGLKTAALYMAATTVGNYALFSGGMSWNSSRATLYNYTNAYNTSLTYTEPTSLDVARHMFTATTVGNYAIFAGGNTSTSSTPTVSSAVDVYNTSLTHMSNVTELSTARLNLLATTVGNYAIFAGGNNSSNYQKVDVYDNSLTHLILNDLPISVTSQEKNNGQTVTIGNYALFGGSSVSQPYNIAAAYNTSLTLLSSYITLNFPSNINAPYSVGNLNNVYALALGCQLTNNQSGQTVNTAINTSLTTSTITPLSSKRSYGKAQGIGNYCIYVGGLMGSGSYRTIQKTVDVYTLQ